jgi:glutamate/tyrosine decarboxylase-like PLP-dependent enzyme
MSPVAAQLGEVMTGWLRDLLGLPTGTAAVFVTGTAMANTAALAAARDRQLAWAGWDVQADGLFGAPRLTVVTGQNTHATLARALGLVGLDWERVIRVPADDQGHMRADRIAITVDHGQKRAGRRLFARLRCSAAKAPDQRLDLCWSSRAVLDGDRDVVPDCR